MLANWPTMKQQKTRRCFGVVIIPLKVEDQESQGVSVRLRQITDVLIHQGDAVVVI